MTEERPPVVAQQRFAEHRDTLERLDLQGRFDYIFQHNLWSSPESRSGLGSTLAETETLRREIPALLGRLGVRSLLDIPCGDFGWLSRVELGVEYTGADIVAALVERNTSLYGAPGRRFLHLDLTAGPLPRAEVVLCRDCLVHLSYANIRRVFGCLGRSGSEYLLMTSFLDLPANRDIQDGDWRPLNFCREPFSLPEPAAVIVENCVEAGGAFRDKALCLWRIADLPQF